MKLKVDTAITATLVLCALVTTGLVIRREFGLSAPIPGHMEQKPIFVEDWRAHLAKGVRLGPLDAPVQLIEFADFECPFCASFAKTLKVLFEHHPNKVTLTFIHFPLPMHRFALPAARVTPGRFERMHGALVQKAGPSNAGQAVPSSRDRSCRAVLIAHTLTLRLRASRVAAGVAWHC